MSQFYKSPSKICVEAWQMRERAMAATREALSPNDTTSNWGWVYQKTPWVMVTSLQEIDDPVIPAGIRTRHILFCGQTRKNDWGEQYIKTTTGGGSDHSIYSSFDVTYDKTYNRPIPGLKEISVEYKGSYGATREIKIRFKLWTDEQLEIYELLYMVPSAGVRVEWGWSLTPDGRPVIPVGIDEGTVLDDIAFEKKVRGVGTGGAVEKQLLDKDYSQGLQAEYLGHYDALQGLVSHFSWTKEPDGSYECEIAVIARGEAYLSTPIQSHRKKIAKDNSIQTLSTDNKENPKDNPPSTVPDMMGVWQNCWKQVAGEQKRAYITLDSKKPIGPKEGEQELVGCAIKLKYDPPQGYPGFTLFGLLKASEDLPYVSLQFILTHMINANLADVIKGASNEEGYPLSHDPELRAVSKFVDDEPIYVGFIDGMVSTNPLVCILPGEDDKYKETDKNGNGLNKYSIEASKTYFDKFAKLAFAPYKDDDKRIDLRFILINLEYIKTKFDESETVDQFLSAILSEISAAFGDQWDFSLNAEAGLVRIIESHTVAEKNPTPLPINLSMAGNNTTLSGTCIRSFSMESDITSKVMAEIMYGANSEVSGSDHSGEKGKASTYAYKLYKVNSKNLAIGGQGETTAPDDAKGKDKGEKNTNDGKKLEETPGQILTEALNQLRKSITYDKIVTAKNCLREYLLKKKSDPNNKDIEASQRPLMGIKLRFTCDGFSLFKTGYMISPNFLPKRFAGWLEYMILKVSHSVNASDWTTEVECILRPKFGQLKKSENALNNAVTQKEQNVSTSASNISKVATSTPKEPLKRKAKTGEIVENGRVPEKWMNTTVISSTYNKGMLFEIGAAEDLVALNNAFKAQFGMYIPITDGYRSYEAQNAIFDWDYYNETGKRRKKGTKNTAASYPGTSNHGWGKAFDFDTSYKGKSGFESETYKWLLANAPTYGWDNPEWARQGKPSAEPWHFEYNGRKSKF